MGLSARIHRYVVLIGTILLIIQNGTSAGNNIAICRTHYCEKTALNILINGNFTVRPCDDFYEHACGLFIRWRDIPQNSLTLNYPHVITKMVQRLLKDVLELPKVLDDSEAIKKAKDLYATCMNTDTIDQHGFEIFEYYLRVGDGWPMIQHRAAGDTIHKPWQYVHSYLTRLTGFGALLDLRVYAHNATNNQLKIHLDQPRYLYGIYDRTMNETQKGYYKEFIKDIALLFAEARGTDLATNDLNSDVENVMRFRERLAEIMASDSEVRNVKNEYNIFTLAELESLNDSYCEFPKHAQINWIDFLSGFLVPESPSLKPTDVVIVKDPGYMSNLMYALGNTTLRTIVNHIGLNFVENHLNYAPSAVREKAQSLYEKMTGQKGLLDKDRWKFCIAEHPMQHVLGKMFVDVKVPLAVKRKVKFMAEYIKDVLKSKIANSTWVDVPTKEEAILKLDSMNIISGYPDWYDDPTKMEQYYSVQSAGVEALQNALSYSSNLYRMETMVLHQTPIGTMSYHYPTDRYVVYLFDENTLYINAAMLQWPNIDVTVPEYINFAALGTQISEEIVQAVGLVGMRFDENGLAKDWWGESLEEYKTRLQCIANKYSGFEETFLSPHVRSIAEVMSVRLVTDAYLKYSSTVSTKPAPRLPGLSVYNTMETFFLVFGSFACEKIDPIYNLTLIRQDFNNPPDLRVNIPLMLSSAFNQINGCYDFSVMNPKDKCEIWGS